MITKLCTNNQNSIIILNRKIKLDIHWTLRAYTTKNVTDETRNQACVGNTVGYQQNDPQITFEDWSNVCKATPEQQ